MSARRACSAVPEAARSSGPSQGRAESAREASWRCQPRAGAAYLAFIMATASSTTCSMAACSGAQLGQEHAGPWG